MLRLALAFLVIALIAAFLGFFNLVMDVAGDILKVLFFVFLVLAVLTFLGGGLRRPAD